MLKLPYVGRNGQATGKAPGVSNSLLKQVLGGWSWNSFLPGIEKASTKHNYISSLQKKIYYQQKAYRKLKYKELTLFSVPHKGELFFSLSFLIFLFLSIFWGKVKLCRPGWPLAWGNSPTSASQVLGLQMCATMPSKSVLPTCCFFPLNPFLSVKLLPLRFYQFSQ